MESQPPILQGELVLYLRAGCQICEEADAALRRVLQAAGRTVRRVDVSQDGAAEARYGARVPVLTCGGREYCSGPFDPAVLSALFGAPPPATPHRRRWPSR